MTVRILLVEDEDDIAGFLLAGLRAAGFAATRVGTLAEARSACAQGRPALVILDLGLPDGSGLSLLALLRADGGRTPVLVLSAIAGETDKVSALDAGADDYLTKPFGFGELLARVRVALRHAGDAPAEPGRLAFGDLVIDLGGRRVTRHGVEVKLAPVEFRLLARLAATPGRVVTHRQLLADVWGPEYVDDTHYLRIHMGRLRAKLEERPAEPRFLRTETGVGYRLAID